MPFLSVGIAGLLVLASAAWIGRSMALSAATNINPETGTLAQELTDGHAARSANGGLPDEDRPQQPPEQYAATSYQDWMRYSNPLWQVSFRYPPAWQPNQAYAGEANERYDGADGFFQIMGAGGTGSVDDIAGASANHILHPYGSAPVIVSLLVDGQDARLILPSDDQPAAMNGLAELLVALPQRVQLGSSTYTSVDLFVDKDHIRGIAATLHY